MAAEIKQKHLYFTYELSPFCKVGESVAHLDEILKENVALETEVRAIMPRFGIINERRNRLHEVKRLSGSHIDVGGIDYISLIKVASLPQAKLQTYFLDSEDFFKKKIIFRNTRNTFLKNNDERLIYFAKGAVDMLKKLGWFPDVIYCYGWFSALIPLFLKDLFQKEKDFENTKIIQLVADDYFEESLHKKFLHKVKLSNIDIEVEHYDSKYEDLLKGGIFYADATIFLQQSPNDELLSFTKEINKPFDFYDKNKQKNIADFITNLLK